MISTAVALYLATGVVPGVVRAALLAAGLDRHERLADVGRVRWRLFYAAVYGVLAGVGWPVYLWYTVYDMPWRRRVGRHGGAR